MARPDRGKWAAAYQKEYQWFKDRNALAVVNVLEKYKVPMCVRGDQQREGVDFSALASDLYSP